MSYVAHGHEHGLGRVPHPETPQAAAAYPITAHPGYRAAAVLPTYKYWYEGSAWLDQGNTGTCVFNAGGHRYADSPTVHSGITEQLVQQEYVEATGDSSLQQGTSGLVLCRYYYKKGKISAYHWITSPDELRTTIQSLGTVCIGIDWYNSMFRPVDQYSNSYLKIDASSGIAGGHEVEINGINLSPTYGQPYYRIKNSWGTSWGHGGTVRAVCTELENLIFNHNGDAVLMTENAQLAA